jgi:hypothetical protein
VFQVLGRLTWNLIFGAAGSTGAISPRTRQYSPAPAVAATVSLPVTVATGRGQADRPRRPRTCRRGRHSLRLRGHDDLVVVVPAAGEWQARQGHGQDEA